MYYYVFLRNSPSFLRSSEKVKEHNFFWQSQDIFSEPRFRTYHFILNDLPYVKTMTFKDTMDCSFESRTVKSKFTRRHYDWSCVPGTFSLTLVREPIRERIKRQQYTGWPKLGGPPYFKAFARIFRFGKKIASSMIFFSLFDGICGIPAKYVVIWEKRNKVSKKIRKLILTPKY